jgi:hypothetical protein
MAALCGAVYTSIIICLFKWLTGAHQTNGVLHTVHASMNHNTVEWCSLMMAGAVGPTAKVFTLCCIIHVVRACLGFECINYEHIPE